MGRVVDGDQNVKIFVLYLMENIGYPLSFLTLNDILMETDYVMYLDFAENFGKMLDDGLIRTHGQDKNGDDLYEVTEHGRIIARELHSDLLPIILKDSMKCALRYLDFRRRQVTWSCHIEKRDDGRYDLNCSMHEKGVEILHISIVVDTRARAEAMKRNVDDNPEVIYRSSLALLSGEVNYMFNL